MAYQDFEPTIGLEIHAQLSTKSKIFSADSTQFGSGDNENVSLVSLGFPGTLPVLNENVLRLAVKMGLALNGEIPKKSVFARKNYFYPDLAKGYQISQFDQPTCVGGYVEFFLDDELNRVQLTRAHIEEDAGKSLHRGDHSLINFNRAGVPLLEIVSEPEIKSARQAAEYARMMKLILSYAGVCDGNLEEGSMRCDCNVSVKRKDQVELGQRVEIKNLNSFRFIEKAIDFEIDRQIDLIESGQTVEQETRLYDSAKNKTYTMRKKEEAHDYRYFPDPDLLPVVLEDDFIAEIRTTLPELPSVKQRRFVSEFGLSLKEALFLTSEKEVADFFEEVCAICKNAAGASAWIQNELFAKLNHIDMEFSEKPLTAHQLGEMIQLIDKKVISGKMGKKVFDFLWDHPEASAEEAVETLGLKQISDSGAIEELVAQTLMENPSSVEEFRSGKHKVVGFLVGQIMKKSKGQANPQLVNKILMEKLKGDT